MEPTTERPTTEPSTADLPKTELPTAELPKTELPKTMRQIQSRVDASGTVSLRLATVEVPEVGEGVLVRVEATPINPSDLGLMLAAADLDSLATDGATVTATVPPAMLATLGARLGQWMPVGNEACGTAIAGPLAGQTVAIFGGAMYAEYRVVPVESCLVLPEGTDPRDGASCFVNPLTALGMTETMRLEGHTALVHTAAASNLGQMLNRICLADGIALVNIVRRPEQAELLRSQGATHVVDSSRDSFIDDLTQALIDTGATIGFDATGGGELGGKILAAMEAAAQARTSGGGFSRYGSTVHKQLYLYGSLDRSPTTFNRTFGMAWGMGGWLLGNFLNRVGPEVADRLRQRVVDELTTTFASHYTGELTLAEVLDIDNIKRFGAIATQAKTLIRPHGVPA